MAISDEALFEQIKILVSDIPELTSKTLETKTQIWLGRARAVVKETGDLLLSHNFETALNSRLAIGGIAFADQITQLMYQALAIAELKAPPGVRGAFIPATNEFDALKSISGILGGAQKDLLFLDPYMDEKVLLTFASTAPENIKIRLLTDVKTVKAALQPTAQAWVKQYAGTRPLELRHSAPRSLHDRAIFVDGADVHSLSQSFNAFAQRSPATISKLDPDTAALKIAAYEELWTNATVVI